jgi:roadblock/LC7 domain-containing protein
MRSEVKTRAFSVRTTEKIRQPASFRDAGGGRAEQKFGDPPIRHVFDPHDIIPLEMRPKIIKALIIFFIFTVSVQAVANEPVRNELVRLQNQSGLTLASFYRSIETVRFSDRSLSEGKELLSMTGEGAISRDGTEIAVEQWRPQHSTSLSIVKIDGTDPKEIPGIAAPYGICWSYDKSKLAMNEQNLKRGTTPPNDNLQIFNIASRDVVVVDVRASVTSQCWSPDGKKIAYDADDSVRVYDMEQKRWQVLGKGKDATWSTDGNWIAFLDDDVYYAITASGSDRKELFKVKGAMSGLWWSPDSRIVAYVSRNKSSEPPLIAVDVEWVRLRVRRLADQSEDWVAQLSDVHIPSYQWVEIAALKRN